MCRKLKIPSCLSKNRRDKSGKPSRVYKGREDLVAIVIVLVPIALGPPAMFMFIPPPVTFAPATLARLVQFTAFVICLGAVASMALDSAVEIMLGMSDPALAAVVAVFGVKPWDCREQQSCGQYGSGKQGCRNGRKLGLPNHELRLLRCLASMPEAL
jgi:hypothetical protein